MNSFIQSGYKTHLRPNIDIKVFCSDVQGGYSFNKEDNIVGGSYMSASDYYVCRDGVVRKPMVIFGMKIDSCSVATEYKLKTVPNCGTCSYSYDCHCRTSEEAHGGGLEVCSTCHASVYMPCNKDDSTYDTGKIDLTGYNISICNSASIIDDIKNVNIVELYDPNLVVNYQ